MPEGTLRAILKQAGIDPDVFQNLGNGRYVQLTIPMPVWRPFLRRQQVTGHIEYDLPHASGVGESGTGMRQFYVIIERDEQGLYVGSVPQLPFGRTQGRSLDELMQRMREAVELCLDIEGSPSQSLEFVGIQQITIAA
jgi:predicted RNase H-like HicB family nuclease